MTGLPMTRRTLLALAASTAVAASGWSAVAWAELTDDQQQSLLQLARRLYPHDALADEVYAEVLAPLYDLMAGDPALAESVRNGVGSLNDATGGDWFYADANVQIAALIDIESSSFFKAVQEAVRFNLYVQPAVWKLIGYPGSSVEYGGYIDRGFDDIDWLPDD